MLYPQSGQRREARRPASGVGRCSALFHSVFPGLQSWGGWAPVLGDRLRFFWVPIPQTYEESRIPGGLLTPLAWFRVFLGRCLKQDRFVALMLLAYSLR